MYGGKPWDRVGTDIMTMTNFVFAVLLAVLMYGWGRTDGEYKAFKFFIDKFIIDDDGRSYLERVMKK